MDLAIIRDHLEQARVHVAEGYQRLERQRELVLKMEEAGNLDTTAARNLLRVFEETQQLHVDDHHRLKQMLADETKRQRRS